MKSRKTDIADQLTPADLVVLAMLAETASHGYEIVAELARRHAGGDPAPISRAQTYYCLKKLLRLGLIAAAKADGAAAGPERAVYRTSPAGKRAMSAAIARPEWARQRPLLPFATWLMLVGHAEPADRAAVLRTRRAFLDEQIQRETLAAQQLEREGSDAVVLAVASHAIEVLRLENKLLEELEAMLA